MYVCMYVGMYVCMYVVCCIHLMSNHTFASSQQIDFN
jgi:hypothetical protein